MIRCHATITGRVQGVGFRYQAQLTAQERGLTGWVRNNADGSVALEVQGKRDAVEGYFESLKNLRFPVQVDHIDKTEFETTADETSFTVRS